MKLSLKFARTAEERARRIAPLPLAEYAGDAYFAEALNKDRLYLGCVSAALGLALLSGGGFGHTALSVGWLQTNLWCLTAAGLAVRALVPETAMNDGNDLIINRALGLWSLLIAVSAVLTSLASGASALPAIAAAGLTAVILGIASRASISGKPWVAPASLVLGLVAIISHYERVPIIGFIAASVATVVISIILMRIKPMVDGKANAILMLTRLAALAWAWAIFDSGELNDFRFITFTVVLITLAVLDIAAGRRQSFAIIISTVIFIHLSGMVQDIAGPHTPMWTQIAAVFIEAVLLVIAGFRHSIAALWLLPTATYRAAPLCVVARLDRAQDHPVKINVT